MKKEHDLDEIMKGMDQDLIEGVANDIKEITLQELANILEASTYIITTNHAEFITNTFEHPTIGIATTIQAFSNGALLVKQYLRP